MDPQWTFPSLMTDNPMAWLIQMTGLMVDARKASTGGCENQGARFRTFDARVHFVRSPDRKHGRTPCHGL